MKIGIVGPADRSVAWEKHLRPHHFVTEVIIAATLEDMGSVDACFLLDETDNRLHNLLKAIKLGYHTFFISALPTDPGMIEKIYHASQEANVRLQFSHWPTLAPASQWMTQKIKSPSFIQVIKEIGYTSFLESNLTLDDLWIDELAYCLKYMGGNVHQIEVNASKLQSGNAFSIHLLLRFDSGATAGIYISTCASETRHKRLVSDHSLLLDCDVETQTVRVGKEHTNSHLFFEKNTFDSSLAAEKSALQFLKAVQLKQPTLYNAYDLLQLTHAVSRIKERTH